MQNAESKVIHEVSTALNMLVDSLDLPALQVVFAELFDRVNEGVLAARLDADDVLLERFVELRTADGATFSAPVDWLSDAERLKSQLRAATVTVRAWSGSDTIFRAAPVRKRVQGDCRSKECEPGLLIVAAGVRAVRDDSP